MDGVDVALLQTDGVRIGEMGAFKTYPLQAEDREIIMAAVRAAAPLTDRAARPEALKQAEARVTIRHIEAVQAFAHEFGIDLKAVATIGFHGQTVLHRPEIGLTIQLGDGQAMANVLRVPVVYDFRANDMALGGQGAPLAPVYHKALASFGNVGLPCAFLNIGGVANITAIDAKGEMLAFDTGPGNALLDDWMLQHRGVPYDKDGACAKAGKVNEAALTKLLDHDLLRKAPPKSLDRYDFPTHAIQGLGVEDGAATLTAFTAQTISDALAFLPQRPTALVATGGGVWNPQLIHELAHRSGVKVFKAEDLDFNSDAVEAQAFAYMAARSMAGLPISFAGTTGVKNPAIGGVLVKPE